MSVAATQLEEARASLERCAEDGRTLIAAIDDETWGRRPARGGWSVAECFKHLILTADRMLPLIRAGVEEARSKGWHAGDRLHAGVVSRILAWSLEPPYRLKTTTQPGFVPEGVDSKAEILDGWDRTHRAFDELIRGAGGLALDRPRLVSPFDPRGRVRYSAYAALLIVGAHERRHLWQARRAAEDAK